MVAPPDYNSPYIYLDKSVTSVIIPDDIPNLLNFTGMVIFGISSVDDAGNESDIVLTQQLSLKPHCNTNSYTVSMFLENGISFQGKIEHFGIYGKDFRITGEKPKNP